ncbi:MAG: GNAT family N-acetyltransferase [Propionibacterium sp.]|nr:GNAT family N-acetyltransferase [Propionibacterium sp.]
MQFEISDLNPDDVAAAAKAHIVMQAATYAPYAKGDFTSQLFDSLERRIPEMLAADRAVVARNPFGNIIGVAMAGDGPERWEATDSPHFVWPAVTRYLKTLFTMPGTHGSGLGSAMLEAALPGMEPAYLWTMTDNPRAIRFYEKHGFAPDGYESISDGFGSMHMIRMVRA